MHGKLPIVALAVFFALFLTITDLVRLLSLMPVLTLARATFLLMVVMCGYLFAQRSLLSLAPSTIAITSVLLVGWPFATVLWAPALSVRDVGLQVLYLATTLASGVLFAQHWQLIRPLAFATLILGLAFGIASVISPGTFQALRMEAEVDDNFRGRAFGLYLQPNQYAHSLALAFLLHMFACDASRVRERAVSSAILAVSVAISGSRGGMLVAGALIAIFVLAPMVTGYVRGAGTLAKNSLLACLAFLSILVASLAIFSEELRVFDKNGAAQRFGSLLSSRQLSQDGSIAGRLYIQKKYIELIKNRPLVGHGLGAPGHFMQKGRYLLYSSHNAFLEHWFTYGAIGLALLVATIVHFGKILSQSAHESPRILRLAFFASVFGVAMSTNMLMQNRAFYVVLGAGIGLAIQRNARDYLRYPVRPVKGDVARTRYAVSSA